MNEAVEQSRHTYTHIQVLVKWMTRLIAFPENSAENIMLKSCLKLCPRRRTTRLHRFSRAEVACVSFIAGSCRRDAACGKLLAGSMLAGSCSRKVEG